MSKNEILSFLQEHKNEISKQFRVTRIGLFGSYSKNLENDNSDIDIIVEGDEIDDEKFKLFLEKGLNKKIDLVKKR
ncbi:MAG: nucleotidyltransferase domain-containing protein [Candidatus Cloacimonetes bacterium]|nr:nucleotidyltransferase domain-containing protein [Candidatus Cloacimonadota bacterium]MCF7814999.1 nucleotidyltransferase domain-containing protein [Candidatus Cloacimonadota bacterium]MCF7869242.1 nucleotidyltransferase domain-containing protein [Candidatus Cloacimonadota bacterium]MCF7884676.1 nucleotidyltransferase domain-containing protein [Candidatus Cloacimonadota bacterium]